MMLMMQANQKGSFLNQISIMKKCIQTKYERLKEKNGDLDTNFIGQLMDQHMVNHLLKLLALMLETLVKRKMGASSSVRKQIKLFSD